MQINFRKRRSALRKKLKSVEAESALITDETNVTYLTGFTGDSTYLFITPKNEILLSDSRYSIQIEEECPELDSQIRTAKTNLLDHVANVLKRSKPKNLAIEAHKTTKSDYDKLNEKLRSTQMVDTNGMVEELRAIKDKSEVDTIRRAISIAERSFQVIRSQLTPEQTELQIAHNLEHQIRGLGGSACSFEPIVGVGPRGALPHGRPSGAVVGDHPFLLMDWGAKYRGYASDLTRILVTGKISPKLERVYNVVLKAQLAAINKLRPGAKLKEVDRAARKVIQDAGFGRRFGHGLGHGFGLQIHELPFMSPSASGTLKSGMVVTVEPGIYLTGWGGVRIEDDVLITSDGHEVLTKVPKVLEESVVEID